MIKNRALLFKVATIALAISFFLQVLTAIAMVFFQDALSGMRMFGMVVEIHEYNGFLFTALVFVHLWFNWGWVRVNILKRGSR